MAENKIFAGPRVRRIRSAKGQTQTAMAEALGISPSYLNLIERNQRPLTVQLLLKLASVYKVDLDELQGEAGGMAGQLREVFGDPLLVRVGTSSFALRRSEAARVEVVRVDERQDEVAP